MRAIVVDKKDDAYNVELKEIEANFPPEDNVTVSVKWSSFNYKDGLALTGKSPVVRKFPMVAGIDFAGIVEKSEDSRFKVGDEVLLNGWGLGETHWGAYAEKSAVKADWLLHMPKGLSMRQAMQIGTAGYTAMLCVLALERHGVTPDKGEILVSGASGGVGSVAVAVLSKLGYEVVAISGRNENSDYLKELGAKEVLPRAEFSEVGKPLAKERWAGAIDVVGGNTLANICASVKYGGTVAACGLAGSMDFPSSVAPFILRGITLAGIDSVMCPIERRIEAWERLSKDLDLSKLDKISHEIAIEDLIAKAPDILAGKIKGRLVVKVA